MEQIFQSTLLNNNEDTNSFYKNSNISSSSIDTIQFKKDYIEYNITNFFKHYKLEHKIKKLNTDCINLSLFRESIINLLQTIPKLNQTTKPSLKQPLTPSKSITKTKTTYSNHTSNKHSLSNRSTSSHNHQSLNPRPFSTLPDKNPFNTLNIKHKKIFHTRTKTTISNESTSLTKINKSSTITDNTKGKVTPTKKIITLKKRNLKLTPDTTRNSKTNTLKTYTTLNNTPNKRSIKKNIITNTTPINSNNKKTVEYKRQHTPKIGNFKNEDNKEISPIFIDPKSKRHPMNKNKKTNIHSIITHTNPNTTKHSKNNSNKLSLNTSSKLKDITLNTSTELVDSSGLISEKEVAENLFNSNYKSEHFSLYFDNKVIQALYLALTSGFISPVQKFKTIHSIPELYRNYPKRKLLKELLRYYESIYKNNSAFINKYDLRGVIVPFIPSKKAQNGLNFLTKEEEKYLLRKEQSNEIINIFVLILLLLNEEINIQQSSKEFLSNCFNIIYSKYNINTMKQLFMNYIIPRLPSLNNKYIELIIKHIETYPSILDRSIILSINQSVSYITFILCEIYTYLSLKTVDGVFYYKLRAKYEENILLNEKMSILSSHLSSML